jgi:small GTP-binding protein
MAMQAIENADTAFWRERPFITITLVGSTNVGKTTLFHRVLHPRASMHYHVKTQKRHKTTVTQDLGECNMEIPGFGKVKCKWLDHPGAEQFQYCIPPSLRRAHVVVLMGDMTSLETIDRMMDWKHRIRQHTDAPIAVLWNKLDLWKEQSFHLSEETHALSNAIESCNHAIADQTCVVVGSVSAMYNDGVESAVHRIIQMACDFQIEHDLSKFNGTSPYLKNCKAHKDSFRDKRHAASVPAIRLHDHFSNQEPCSCCA